MSLKRLISMMAVCLLGALVLSGPAAAGEDDTMAKITCAFEGLAGSAEEGGDGVNSLFTDTNQGQAWDPAELMDTDPGLFSFDGDATCAGVDIASEHKNQGPETAPPTTVHIDASGIYDNLICGTGEAKGTALVTGTLGGKNALNAGGGISINSVFSIQFDGGVGHLSIVVQEPSQLGQNEVDQGSGQGVVDILPTTANSATAVPCVGGAAGPGVQNDEGNVIAFTVSGAFETTLAGEGSEFVGPASDSDL